MIFFKGKPVKQLTAEEARKISDEVTNGIDIRTYLFMIETRAKAGARNLTIGGHLPYNAFNSLTDLGYKVEYHQKDGIYIISW